MARIALNFILTPFSLARGLYDEEMLWSAIVKSGSKMMKSMFIFDHKFLTDTGENVQKWTRYFLLFFSTRSSDEYDSAPSRKYSRPLLDFFACIG